MSAVLCAYQGCDSTCTYFVPSKYSTRARPAMHCGCVRGTGGEWLCAVLCDEGILGWDGKAPWLDLPMVWRANSCCAAWFDGRAAKAAWIGAYATKRGILMITIMWPPGRHRGAICHERPA